MFWKIVTPIAQFRDLLQPVLYTNVSHLCPNILFLMSEKKLECFPIAQHLSEHSQSIRICKDDKLHIMGNKGDPHLKNNK